MSAFVSEFGKIYFIDLGVLRMIDSNGNVQTIAGQPRNFGIGYNPVSARYSQINFFELNGDDIYIRNELENQIVKFSLNGGSISLVAGNSSKGSPAMGSSAVSSPLPNCGWSTPCGFTVDVANNRLYHYSGTSGAVAYINLTNGLWVQQATGFQDSNARVSYIGQNSDGLLAYLSSHHNTSAKVTIRMFNQTTNTSTTIYGLNSIEPTSSLSSTICTGVNGTTCTYSNTLDATVQTRFKYDSSIGWLLTRKGANAVYSIPSLGGIVNHYETMNNNFVSYEHYKNGTDEFIYYCSTSGALYKRNVATDTETALTLPISSMKCDSNSLFYHPGRNSLIFAYKQNGLFGIAEYLSP